MLGVVILGAGQSSRMGRPKLLLPWGKVSIIEHLIRTWQNLDARQIATVCAAGDTAIQIELDRLGHSAAERIINPAPERGMFSSVQTSALWTGWREDLTHWAVVLGDQPHLSEATLRQIIEFCTVHPNEICVPQQGDHRRHPVLLPRVAFLQMANSTAKNLREFLDESPVKVARCKMDDPALELDLDRPEDYEHARRQFLR
jgi:molybdenum cofactor cytidylyltransferase